MAGQGLVSRGSQVELDWWGQDSCRGARQFDPAAPFWNAPLSSSASRGPPPWNRCAATPIQTPFAPRADRAVAAAAAAAAAVGIAVVFFYSY